VNDGIGRLADGAKARDFTPTFRDPDSGVAQRILSSPVDTIPSWRKVYITCDSQVEFDATMRNFADRRNLKDGLTGPALRLYDSARNGA
jgi:hypothetical protein